MCPDNPDWLLVIGGSPKSIRAALDDMVTLCEPERPGPCAMIIDRLPGGRFAVRWGPSFAPYYIVDLPGWVPFHDRTVASAVAWITSRATGMRYAIFDDPANPRGDTARGVSSAGESIIIDASNVAVRRAAVPVRGVREPRLRDFALERVSEFTVQVELEQSTFNPDFVVTDAPDDA